MADPSVDTHAGQAAYSPWVLRVYDAYVLGLSNRWIWRCPTSKIVAHYDRYVSANHLDVGVGSGYFLDRCTFPSTPKVTLFDMNANSLEHTARRIARYQPVSVRGDVLDPEQVPAGPFGSVGFNYVLHCLPGEPAGSKWRAIENLAAVLDDDGVLFGSTILHRDERLGWAQRKLMNVYNRKGIFGNAGDGMRELEDALNRRFEWVEIERHGVVALFAGRGPKRVGAAA